MHLLARQSPAGSGPPGFDLGPYKTVPLLNQREPLLGITITFIVRPSFSRNTKSLAPNPASQVCSWICLLLRLYVRFLVQRSAGWDDFFLILTMVG